MDPRPPSAKKEDLEPSQGQGCLLRIWLHKKDLYLLYTLNPESAQVFLELSISPHHFFLLLIMLSLWKNFKYTKVVKKSITHSKFVVIIIDQRFLAFFQFTSYRK